MSESDREESKDGSVTLLSSLYQEFRTHGNIKLIYFFKAISSMILYPYLTLFSVSLGLSETAAGISGTFTVLSILAQPLVGVLADKIGNFKRFLAILTAITPIPALLFLLLPTVSRAPHTKFINAPYECNWTGSSAALECIGSLCPLPTSKILQLVCGAECENVRRNATDEDFSGWKAGEFRLLPDGSTIVIESVAEDVSKSLICPLMDSTGTVGKWCMIDHVSVKSNTSSRNGSNVNRNYYQHGNSSTGSKCTSIDGNRQCGRSCHVIFERENEDSDNYWTVLISFTVLRMILLLLSAMCWITYEGAVLSIIKETGGNYGIQRCTILLAALVVPPLSGYMIDYFKDFRPVVLFYAAVQFVSAYLTLYIDLDFRKPGQRVTKTLLDCLAQPQVLGLLFAVFASGIGWGFLESFLYVHIANLGGSKLLMGLTSTVSAAAAFPFLILCKDIVGKFGHSHIISLGLIFYGLRCWGYSNMTDPWMSLIYECGEAITSGLAMTAVQLYAVKLSCSNTVVTIQGIIGSLYYVVGRSLGGLIGGFLMPEYGAATTFQVIGAGVAVAGVVYSSVGALFSYLARRSKE